MTLGLTKRPAALARHFPDALDYACCPFAPQLDPLEAILAKLDPPAPRREPLLKVHASLQDVSGRKRRAGSVIMKARVTGDADR
jgi:hypothetical protein